VVLPLTKESTDARRSESDPSRFKSDQIKSHCAVDRSEEEEEEGADALEELEEEEEEFEDMMESRGKTEKGEE
jgi:hypothetical protein